MWVFSQRGSFSTKNNNLIILLINIDIAINKKMSNTLTNIEWRIGGKLKYFLLFELLYSGKYGSRHSFVKEYKLSS